MYSTCIYCHASLGANEVIERFPVGRRVAFDPAKGRLWVVCRSCGRWNLAPLEERWEALEECERLFRGTRLRASTDNVGLAKLREGMELVRVGPALRPELAIWRYGDQLVRRRRVHIASQVVVWAAWMVGTAPLSPWASAAGYLGGGWLVTAARWRTVAAERRLGRMVLSHVPRAGAREEHDVPVRSVRQVRLLPRGADEWLVQLRYSLGLRRTNEQPPRVEIVGDPALRALRVLLPLLNRSGGKRATVDDAVRKLEAHGTGAPFVAALSARIERQITKPRDVRQLPREDRLALEMAVCEEMEQRAMQGELALLEAAWREAEEVAAIADDLVVPEWVRRSLERHARDSRRVQQG